MFFRFDVLHEGFSEQVTNNDNVKVNTLFVTYVNKENCLEYRFKGNKFDIYL